MKIFVELITWRICYDSRAATAALAKTIMNRFWYGTGCKR
jgi:hypothetical protein